MIFSRIFTVFWLGFIGLIYADNSTSNSEINEYCGYSFIQYPAGYKNVPKNNSRISLSENKSKTMTNGKKTFVFVFDCKDDDKKSIENTTDYSDAGDSPSQFLTARQVVEQEDAGGRYFRHILSQFDVRGSDWSGTIAYVDYQLGDGIKTKLNIYFVCQNRSDAPCFRVFSPEWPHGTEEQNNLKKIIKTLSFRHQ